MGARHWDAISIYRERIRPTRSPIEFKIIREDNGRDGRCVREKRDAYDGPFSAALRGGEDGVVFPRAEDDALKAFLSGRSLNAT